MTVTYHKKDISAGWQKKVKNVSEQKYLRISHGITIVISDYPATIVHFSFRALTFIGYQFDFVRNG